MTDQNRERLVLVSGGTRGLGLAIVRRLLTGNYRVVAAGRRPTRELEDLVSASGGGACYEPLDLADTASLHAFVNRIVKTHGPFYGLVNNAAIAHEGVLATMHDSQIAEIMLINATGSMILTKYALRPMLVAKSGRVVNIASIIGSTGFSGLSVYAASKAALLGFTRSLAREVGRSGVTVNSVSPGYMQTDMTSGLSEEKLATIRRRSPLHSLATPDDVAAGVAYLLSPDAARVTGAELTIDAGSTA
jgi:3-oxoacyl-[acyl-carrier protein] reductase